jgi:RHS repeat-associated protein
LQDGLGSVTSLTTSTGALGNTYKYDSFGNLTASSGTIANRFQYTAREFDPETSLYFYRARYYDPSAGKFLSEDPVRFSAGIDFYVYVKNGPVDFLDPYGLKCTQVTPWQEIPTVGAPGGQQPYLTIEVGLWWTRQSWDYANGQEGGTPNSCICTWISGYTRVRKYYRKTVEEEAWFECTSCNGISQRNRETRTMTKKWYMDSEGIPTLPIETRTTTGATFEEGNGDTGCMCSPPSE